MVQYLEWIENTWFGVWVRESGSIWSYPMIITLHSYGMAMLAGVSAVIDLRLLGFASHVPLAPMKRLFLLIRIGFWISLASGIALTIGDAATMLISPVFYIKMLFVALALVTVRLTERRVFGRPELGACKRQSAGPLVAGVLAWFDHGRQTDRLSRSRGGAQRIAVTEELDR
jgi:hypothetical protein